MDNTKAVEEEKLLKPAQSEEELTTAPEEIKVEEAAVITNMAKQDETTPGTGTEKEEEQNSNGISMATEEVQEAVEELLQQTEEKSFEKLEALPDSPETIKLTEVDEVADGHVTEEKLQQGGADSPLTTPEEEIAPSVTSVVSGEGGVSTGEESSEGKEKLVEKKDQTTKEEGKKEKPKKPKRGRDSEHMSRAIVQALAGLNSPEEKIAALCKKYAELLGEHKSLQREHKAQQKQLVMLQRDRDQLQSEHGRAILAKSKLESLCRELQRHNKTIKEESLQRAKDEEEKRKEVSSKFQQTINEITSQMQENHNRNIRLKEENLELASKLKKLVEQYERREEHIEKIFKHKELESQLYEAKLQQSNLALQQEQERCKRERSILLNEAAEAQTKCEMLMKQETQLKAQLAVYTEKFEEFQTTLTKSNEIFQTFKQEMDQMTKKIKKLEKETNMWRVRWENSNKSLLNMAEERTLKEKEMASQKTKVMRLEKLCRALQAERNALTGKAKSKDKEGKDASPSKKKTIQAVGSNTKAAAPVSTSKNAPKNSQVPSSSTGPQETNVKGSEPAMVDSNVLVNGDCNHGDCNHGIKNAADDSGGTGAKETREDKGDETQVREGEASVVEEKAGVKGEDVQTVEREVASGNKEVVTSEIEKERVEEEGEDKQELSKEGEVAAGQVGGDSAVCDESEGKCLDITNPSGLVDIITKSEGNPAEILVVSDGMSEEVEGQGEVVQTSETASNLESRDEGVLAVD